MTKKWSKSGRKSMDMSRGEDPESDAKVVENGRKSMESSRGKDPESDEKATDDGFMSHRSPLCGLPVIPGSSHGGKKKHRATREDRSEERPRASQHRPTLRGACRIRRRS